MGESQTRDPLCPHTVVVMAEPRETEPAPLWHVIVTVGGDGNEPAQVRSGLVRLLEEQPFMHAVRYNGRSAELKYWEEGQNVVDVAALAYRLWWEHRDSCRLPDWQTLGLEVVAQEVYAERDVAECPPGPVEPQPF